MAALPFDTINIFYDLSGSVDLLLKPVKAKMRQVCAAGTDGLSFIHQMRQQLTKGRCRSVRQPPAIDRVSGRFEQLGKACDPKTDPQPRKIHNGYIHLGAQ